MRVFLFSTLKSLKYNCVCYNSSMNSLSRVTIMVVSVFALWGFIFIGFAIDSSNTFTNQAKDHILYQKKIENRKYSLDTFTKNNILQSFEQRIIVHKSVVIAKDFEKELPRTKMVEEVAPVLKMELKEVEDVVEITAST